MVVGWSLGDRITRRLVMDALRMGIGRRRPEPGLVHHSDRGSQYASSESFFGILKTERVFFSNYKTRDEAKRDIVDYVEMFYNSRRKHSYLGYLSPKRSEQARQLQNAA
jgi:transposase InsO family protein